MLRSFLAGAAVGACVDAWTMIPVPASSALPREYLLVTVVGTMLAAGVFALLLGLVLVVGRTDVDNTGPSAAPESGSSTADSDNLLTVVFNVPGMT